jgi:hypothetical protein
LSPEYTILPLSKIIMLSNRLKQYGVGEWMVAQIVMLVLRRPFTTAMTCTDSADHQFWERPAANLFTGDKGHVTVVTAFVGR